MAFIASLDMSKMVVLLKKTHIYLFAYLFIHKKRKEGETERREEERKKEIA